MNANKTLVVQKVEFKFWMMVLYGVSSQYADAYWYTLSDHDKMRLDQKYVAHMQSGAIPYMETNHGKI